MILLLRFWANRNPFAAACTAAGMLMMLFVLPFLIFGSADITEGTGIINVRFPLEIVVYEWFFVVLALIVLWAYDWGRQSGLASRADPGGQRALRWLSAYPVFILGAPLLFLITSCDPAGYLRPLLTIFALNVAVALFEEVVFRGILMHGLRARLPAFQALIGSSLIFGLFHLVNILSGQDFALTMFQVVNAVALGLVLGAAYLQTNTLWAPVFLHFCWNMGVMTSALALSPMPQVATDAAGSADTVTAANFLYPVIIAAVGFYTYYQWKRRVAWRS